MEQNEFYLTITDNGDNQHNAHDIKAKYDLTNFDAYNQGEADEYFGYRAYDKMCLRYPSTISSDRDDISDILYPRLVAKLMKLPKDLTITVHLVSQSDIDFGHFFDEETVRKFALIKANLKVNIKSNKLPDDLIFAHTYIERQLPKVIMGHSAVFYVKSYQHKLDEITDFLGFAPDDDSYSFGDTMKSTSKFRYMTNFTYCSKKLDLEKDEPIEKHIKKLTDKLAEHCDKITNLLKYIDINYSLVIAGNVPNPYQFTIDSDTLNQLAQLRMSVDIDMSFP